MENIDKITIHCSATNPKNDDDVKSLRKMHTDKGWSDIGYHYVIDAWGILEDGRPINRMGAGVRGFNKNNVHICMVGGIDDNGKAVDNFTEWQYDTLRFIITDLVGIYGVKESNIKGHRDYSPDLNGDGVISRNEFIKMCPCFDVKAKMKEWG